MEKKINFFLSFSTKEIEGVTIPAGTDVSCHIYANNHNPRYWDNPSQFNPDRFLTENSDGRDPYSYVPFSAGFDFIFLFFIFLFYISFQTLKLNKFLFFFLFL